MAMTKPAGVFLQLLSIPVMLAGCIEGMAAANQDVVSVVGWTLFALGVLLLWIGRKPAVRRP